MKISLLQIDIAWNDPQANFEHIEQQLRNANKSDVYVLPEMFSTGFSVEPEEIADADGTTLAWMQRMAKELNGAVCGSVAVEKPDYDTGVATDSKGAEVAAKSYFNRFFFVKPNGEYYYYDKRHLFSFAGEQRRYTRGTERIVAEFRGVRFLLQTCYDLRFPIFSRNNEKVPYDVAIYVASWPITRQHVWNSLLHARAIENQCFVAGVNRIGSDPQSRYSGGTQVIGAFGNTLAASPLDEESTITVDIDLQPLRVFRRKFPVLKDADITDIR